LVSESCGGAISVPRRLGLTRGKTHLRREPDGGGFGWGDPKAGAQSLGQRGRPNAVGESAPPPIGTPAVRFS
jgi:hypothetical protein